MQFVPEILSRTQPIFLTEVLVRARHARRILLLLFTTLLVGWVATPSSGLSQAAGAEEPAGKASAGTTRASGDRVAQELPFPAEPLTIDSPIDVVLREGVDRFLDKQLQLTRDARLDRWRRDTQSAEALQATRPARVARLRKQLGLRDERVKPVELQFVETTRKPALIAHNQRVQVREIRWQALELIQGEGLLIEPVGRSPIACVIVIPDADQTPEQVAGLSSGVAATSQYARWLAESGCRVVIPQLVNRQRKQFTWHGRQVDITNREFLYRSAFELGRHLIGYELQKVLALADWHEQENGTDLPLGVAGWGEGGLLALYAAALDERFAGALVSGHFGPREELYRQPIDRNVFGLLQDFGDAELAALIAPRGLVLEAAAGPEIELQGGQGAPASLKTVPVEQVQAEFQRLEQYVQYLPAAQRPVLAVSDGGKGPYGTRAALSAFLRGLGRTQELVTELEALQRVRDLPAVDARMLRTMQQIDRHSQEVLRESPFVRKAYLAELKTDSLEAYEQSVKRYREEFATDVIGRFELPLAKIAPQARLWKSTDKWRGYEVVLPVFDEVIAYGILLVPHDVKSGEKRPVVVCQHGLEGRCQDAIEPLDHDAYQGFAARLAERGYVTFAPQNLYRGEDAFRVLQRKANPLGKTLFSVIVPQHQQIVDWLQSLDFVDPDRVAFYGLSYGGKTAMRVPALVTDYCLSICSADFNEWVDKNASTRNPRSYVWTGEYEIFEFDLGSTYNYAEMAALIAPRPFMVERGHFDGVADDETVGWEFAKVRHHYAARLGIGGRCEIEWFVGPHTIHGVGTFSFLDRHLKWTPR